MAEDTYWHFPSLSWLESLGGQILTCREQGIGWKVENLLVEGNLIEKKHNVLLLVRKQKLGV